MSDLDQIPLADLVSIPTPELLRFYDRAITSLNHDRMLLSGGYAEGMGGIPSGESLGLCFIASHDASVRLAAITAELYRRTFTDTGVTAKAVVSKFHGNSVDGI